MQEITMAQIRIVAVVMICVGIALLVWGNEAASLHQRLREIQRPSNVVNDAGTAGTGIGLADKNFAYEATGGAKPRKGRRQFGGQGQNRNGQNGDQGQQDR